MGSHERQELARQQIETFRGKLAIASNEQLSEKLNDAENLKLFATSITLVGLTVVGTAIGVQEITDHEAVRLAMYAPVITGSAITSFGLFIFTNARFTAQEIFSQAQQRGINVIKGPHRQLDLPKE